MKRTTLTLTLLAAVAAAAAMGGAGQVGAAAALSVTKLECGKPVHAGQFDAVYIVNQGDAAQDLAGWQLRSDPEDSQQMQLGTLGVLNPGEQVIIVAGAHSVTIPSENVYRWDVLEMLRDAGEPPDYAKLFDPSGSFVAGMDCTGQALSTAPPPTPAPPPPQQASGGGDQPNPATASGPKAVPSAGGQPRENTAGKGLYTFAAAAVLLAFSFVAYGFGVRTRQKVPNRTNAGRLMANEGDNQEGRGHTSRPPRG